MIRPGRLSASAIVRMAESRRPEAPLDAALAESIRERSAGNPLFAQALVDHWHAHGAGSALPDGVPGDLRAMLQRRLRDLPRAAGELLECASVAGAAFSPALVAAMVGGNEEMIEEQCVALPILEPSPEGFRFTHSLYPEVIHTQIPAARRARLHLRAGEVLEQQHAPPATVAHHFMEARQPERALPHLEAAAESALRRSAHREAAVYLRRGLDAMNSLPAGRDTRAAEFRLLAMLAPTLIAIEGFSAREAEPAFGRACDLGQQLGDLDRVYPLVMGRAFMYELRGEYFRTEELLGQHLPRLAPPPDSTVTVHTDSLMACSLFHQGRFAAALEHAERGLGCYDPSRDRELLAPYGENPSLGCLSWAALSLWFLGYPDRALRRIQELLAFSETPGHGYTLSTAMLYAAHVHQLRRDRPQAQYWAERTLELAAAQGYPYCVAFAQAVRGWAKAETEGLEEIQAGLDTAAAIGAKLDRPYLLALQAEMQMLCE